MTWTLEPHPGETTTPIVQVLILQHAWHRLTAKSRTALNALANGQTVHPRSLNALHAHGLANENGTLTQAGTEVLRWRPTRGPATSKISYSADRKTTNP